jgi:N-acetylmuramoyl-L-alanine amidase
MKLLADSKHEVIPDVFDRSSDNLKEAVTLANNEGADLFVSIHLNAGGGTGCEAYTWKGEQVPQAVKACSYLKKLGFNNRGVKNGSHLYVIKNTKCTAILLEVCFVDNKADAELFRKVGYEKIAKAIYNAIL